MSGGSYDYASHKVEEMADSLRRRSPSPLRKAFAEHLVLVAEAMHDVEWVDSGDYGPGDENGAIRKVLAPGAEIAAAIASAEEARVALSGVIAQAKASVLPGEGKPR